MTTDLAPAASAAHPSEALCEARGVSMQFVQPRGEPLKVLHDVNLCVHSREVVALLGPSGCGKSTLMRILAGLIQPSQGEVFQHGQALHGLNPGVAIVFQSFALFPWMTVSENVQVVLRSAGLPEDQVVARSAEAVAMVGLNGFEEAYPRELSGGMKQRVGMARALSVHPEMLFMDEPFSQVDALTAESLRSEILDIWSHEERNPKSILMVSHDIKEVAYMADRIVVMGTDPGRIRTIVENHLPRPRDYRDPNLLKLVDSLHDIITGSELPDTPAVAAELGPEPTEPLPPAGAPEVVALMEWLEDHNGSEDVFRISAETNQRFDRLIQVIKAAEMLDFVDTPQRQVTLTALGKTYVLAEQAQRKEIWRKQLLTLALFRKVRDMLLRQGNNRLEKEIVLQSLILEMPHEPYEQLFRTLVAWARFGDLFAYDARKRIVSMQ